MRFIGFPILIILFALSAYSENTLSNIAVLELENNGISSTEATAITNRLRTEMFNTGLYNVLERTKMNDILKEQGFQQIGCTNSACAIQIGQLLNVEYMVMGSADKVGELISLNIRMVNVSTGRIVRSVVEDCLNCPIEDVMTNLIKKVVTQMNFKIAASNNSNEKPNEDTVLNVSQNKRHDSASYHSKHTDTTATNFEENQIVRSKAKTITAAIGFIIIFALGITGWIIYASQD
jgi:TolB-like protein